MFCPNCGTNNPDGSRFCAECGTVFDAEAAIPEIQEAPVMTEEVQPIPEQSFEQPIPEQPVEQPIPEQSFEQSIPEQSIPEQSVPMEQYQQPVEQYQQPVEQYQQPVEQYQQPVEQYQQPVQQYQQPVQQYQQPVQQYQQPVQQYQQPAQQYQQPVYGQPYQQPAVPRAPRKPMDPKMKKKVIIGSACGAVLVAFLIVLFAAIIPNSGLKGRLRHTWRQTDTSRVNVMNLKSKTLTSGSTVYTITNWQAQGDRLAITYTETGVGFKSETYVVAFSPDGKKLYLFDADGYDDGDRPDSVFVRVD